MGINNFSKKEQYWIWLRSLFLAKKQEMMLLKIESDPEKLFIYAKNNDSILQDIPERVLIILREHASFNYLADACEKLMRYNIRVILRDAPSYPALLHHMFQPPELLYLRGENVNIYHPYMVAIVGMREPSTYGLQVTEMLATELAESGICIVSGLAYGIDAAAHQGALLSKQNIATVAILTGGLDNIYPKEHMELAHQIMAQGCLISEYPPNFPVRPYHVPMRNRLIAGMANVIIVPEATFKSGVRHTISWGLEYGRDILVIPGQIDHEEAQLPNYLLQLGAGAVLKAQDVLDVCNFNCSGIMLQSKHQVKTTHFVYDKISSDKKIGVDYSNLSDEENEIIKLLTKQSMSSDELCFLTKKPIYQLLIYLTKLEQKNMIQKDERTNVFHITMK